MGIRFPAVTRRWPLAAAFLVVAGVMLTWFIQPLNHHPPRPPTVERGSTVANFVLPDASGKWMRFDTYVAGRPFIMAFGTTWCPTCRGQIQQLGELHQRYGDKVAILEVNVGEPPERVANYVQQNKIPFPVLLDQNSHIFSQYNSQYVPVIVIGGPDGRVREIGNLIEPKRLVALVESTTEEVGTG